MTLNELHNMTKELIEKGHGELEVRVWADHGQQAMPTDSVDVDRLESDDYMGEIIHPDDYDEYDEYVECVVIS